MKQHLKMKQMQLQYTYEYTSCYGNRLLLHRFSLKQKVSSLYMVYHTMLISLYS